MDLIRALQDVLDPLLEHTTFAPFAPLKMEPLNLEYGGILHDGRVVLFGFYQFSAHRTITALLWTVPDATPGRSAATGQSVLRRHQTWDYDPATDIDGLVQAIVAEVTAWLGLPAPTGGADCEALTSAGTSLGLREQVADLS